MPVTRVTYTNMNLLYFYKKFDHYEIFYAFNYRLKLVL